MSLRPIAEQLAYEDWTDEVSIACKLACVQEPDNYAMLWFLGLAVPEVIGQQKMKELTNANNL